MIYKEGDELVIPLLFFLCERRNFDLYMRKEGIYGGVVKTDEDNFLKCPCHSDFYLHHLSVTSYNRKKEDDETCEMTRTLVHDDLNASKKSKKTVVSKTDNSKNPSDRRSGVVITFACEHCQELFNLNIAQHKGHTFMYWSNASEEKDVIRYDYSKDLKAQARDEKSMQEIEDIFAKVHNNFKKWKI